MEERAEMLKAYQSLYKGMIRKDRKALNDILDDSFVLVHMTGMRQSKGEFIEAVENGTLNYYSATDEDVSVSQNGDEAKLVGKSLVSAAVFGGRRNTWRLRLDVDLIKKSGGWRILSAIASTY